MNPPQELQHPNLLDTGIRLSIKREDRLDPRVSGNKLYKLWGYWLQLREQSKTGWLTFGGYYSNHLHATAALGYCLGIPTVGVVRGHKPERLSPTLLDCERWGMTLDFVSRADYRRRDDPEYCDELLRRYGNHFLMVPEGGAGPEGMVGCQHLQRSLREQVDLQAATLCVACGSGTTLAGLWSESQKGESLLGFSALKLGDQREGYRHSLACMAGGEQGGRGKLSVTDDFCGRGFGRADTELLQFTVDFERFTGVPLEPVYTSKMVAGVVSLAAQGYWPEGHQVVLLHTGGLQGRRGFPELMKSSVS